MFRSAPLSRSLVALAALLLLVAPVAFAADARLQVDASIYDVRPPTKAPTRAGVALAFDGGTLLVQLVASGKGTLPDVNLGFSGETPRTRALDRVDLNAALQRSSKLQPMIGGVVIEHRNTSLATLRAAYAQAMGELGFSVGAGSTLNRWHFVNGTDVVRVNAVSEGKNVIAYVGR